MTYFVLPYQRFPRSTSETLFIALNDISKLILIIALSVTSCDFSERVKNTFSNKFFTDFNLNLSNSFKELVQNCSFTSDFYFGSFRLKIAMDDQSSQLAIGFCSSFIIGAFAIFCTFFFLDLIGSAMFELNIRYLRIKGVLIPFVTAITVAEFIVGIAMIVFVSLSSYTFSYMSRYVNHCASKYRNANFKNYMENEVDDDVVFGISLWLMLGAVSFKLLVFIINALFYVIKGYDPAQSRLLKARYPYLNKGFIASPNEPLLTEWYRLYKAKIDELKEKGPSASALFMPVLTGSLVNAMKKNSFSIRRASDNFFPLSNENANKSDDFSEKNGDNKNELLTDSNDHQASMQTLQGGSTPSKFPIPSSFNQNGKQFSGGGSGSVDNANNTNFYNNINKVDMIDGDVLLEAQELEEEEQEKGNFIVHRGDNEKTKDVSEKVDLFDVNVPSGGIYGLELPIDDNIGEDRLKLREDNIISSVFDEGNESKKKHTHRSRGRDKNSSSASEYDENGIKISGKKKKHSRRHKHSEKTPRLKVDGDDVKKHRMAKDSRSQKSHYKKSSSERLIDEDGIGKEDNEEEGEDNTEEAVSYYYYYDEDGNYIGEGETLSDVEFVEDEEGNKYLPEDYEVDVPEEREREKNKIKGKKNKKNINVDGKEEENKEEMKKKRKLKRRHHRDSSVNDNKRREGSHRHSSSHRSGHEKRDISDKKYKHNNNININNHLHEALAPPKLNEDENT